MLEVNNAILVFLFLTLNIFKIFVSIVDFEQVNWVNFGLVYIYISSVRNPSLLKFEIYYFSRFCSFKAFRSF